MSFAIDFGFLFDIDEFISLLASGADLTIA
jgi:hypothetical protein